MIANDPDVTRALGLARALSGAQRMALVNRLVLEEADLECRLQLAVISRNARDVGETLARAAFVERDRRRRVL